MTSIRARLALPLILMASASACADVELVENPRSHDVIGGGELGAELPRIASNPLAYHEHSEVSRDRPRVLAFAGSRRIQQKVLLLAATGDEPSFSGRTRRTRSDRYSTSSVDRNPRRGHRRAARGGRVDLQF